MIIILNVFMFRKLYINSVSFKIVFLENYTVSEVFLPPLITAAELQDRKPECSSGGSQQPTGCCTTRQNVVLHCDFPAIRKKKLHWAGE